MRFLSLVAFIFFAFSSYSFAHESRPLHIEIDETSNEHFFVQWKIPPSITPDNTPSVSLADCRALQNLITIRVSGNIIRKQDFECPELVKQLVISYPRFNPSISALIHFKRKTGEKYTKLLGPQEEVWAIPEKESALGVARDYTKLGIKHIWEGIDHLLFLVCLLFIAGTGKRILITITGFTIAHSITLALSALEIIKVAVAPVEAFIALSIVFLATEIVKDRRDTLTWRYPIAVSASFGLLHGFGFAAVLNEIGLPQKELATGLLFFNIGVEIGQIAFVLAVIALIKALSVIKLDVTRSAVEKPAAYIVGILASYWMVERITGFWI
jgi:hydrogenase/urease accessory protein HupE